MGKLSHIKKAIDGAKRRVYQGSPHKYDGRLDPSKIGTGEGAQAYGYGHYVAENPSVAKQYQGALSYKELVNNFRKDLPDDAGFDELLEMAQSGKFTDYQNDVIKALADDDWLGFDYPSQAITAAFRDLDNYDPSPALRRAIEGSGHFYEFDLPESAIDNMLDWDAPLSEQSERIQDAISKARDSIRKLSPEYADNMDITGEGLYQLYREYRGGSSQAASEGLKELGIPGIKYHDGMSRAAGEGTRNFVIFPGNEDLVKAISRNGEKLSAAALAPLAGIGLMGTFSEDSQAGVGRTIKAAGKALDMPEAARMQRASDMGFDADQVYYHGTANDIDEFKESAIGSTYGAGVLGGAVALSPEEARAAELDAIALQGERMRSLQGTWRSPEKRDKWKALKSGLYDNLVAPALEGMAAVNRGAVDTINFVGPDQVNAILQLSGSEKRVPTLNNIPGIDEATAGNYMQEGLPRDIVRTGGEFLSPL